MIRSDCFAFTSKGCKATVREDCSGCTHYKLKGTECDTCYYKGKGTERCKGCAVKESRE